MSDSIFFFADLIGSNPTHNYKYRISHSLWLDMIFYSTSCVFSILEPWIKIISNHKLWEILIITCYNTISIFT